MIIIITFLSNFIRQQRRVDQNHSEKYKGLLHDVIQLFFGKT